MTELPTKFDLANAISVLKHYTGADMDSVHAIGEKLKSLLPLYDEGLGGLAIQEVDVYLLGEEPGVAQRSQVHTFRVGDDYKVLPEDEDHDIGEWKVNDIRAHVNQI